MTLYDMRAGAFAYVRILQWKNAYMYEFKVRVCILRRYAMISKYDIIMSLGDDVTSGAICMG